VGERYLLSNHNVTLHDGLVLIAQARPPTAHDSHWAARVECHYRDRRVLARRMMGHLRSMRFWQPLNNHKAVAELGLPVRPLADTLRDALTWFKANGYLS
jgi:hypothetical protein